MTSHVYPMHTHESWALLIVDDGMIRYDLHRTEHGALDQAVTLLPPQVPHNGRAATSDGFRKRVVYLDLSHLPARLIGQAVDQPVLFDPLLRQRISQLHHALDEPGGELEAESRLAFVAERLQQHLGKQGKDQEAPPRADVAHQLRDLIDDGFRGKVTLRQASEAIHAHPAHLVRMFSHGVRDQPAPVPDEPTGRPGAPSPARRRTPEHGGRRRRLLRPAPPEPHLPAAPRHEPGQIRERQAALTPYRPGDPDVACTE